MTTRDYLKEDPVIDDQAYCVVSFVNNDDLVSKKETFYLDRFLRDTMQREFDSFVHSVITETHLDVKRNISTQIEKLKASTDSEDQHIAILLERNLAKVLLDEEAHIEKCRRKLDFGVEQLTDKFAVFLEGHRTSLDREFSQMVDKRVSTRGFKVRGSYHDIEDAQDRARFLRQSVEPGVSTFVAPVGRWIPFQFSENEVKCSDHMLPQLNEFMKGLEDNRRKKDIHFEERKKEAMDNARVHNAEDIKERLRERLNAKRTEKIKKDFEKLSSAVSNPPVPAEAKKKRKKKTTKKAAEHAEQPAEDGAADL